MYLFPNVTSEPPFFFHMNAFKDMSSYFFSRCLSFYYPFGSSQIEGFCLEVYCKWKYFALTDSPLYGSIYRFIFCVLFSNMFPKIEFQAKNLSDLWKSKKMFNIFIADFVLLLIFLSNIVKQSENIRN